MTGIDPDVLAGCRRRNREAERREREAAMSPPVPRPPRPGTIHYLDCSCGVRAGFRLVGDFAPVRVRVMARKAGWTDVHRSEPTGTCPNCTEGSPHARNNGELPVRR